MKELKTCPFCGREPVYVADGKVICICGAMMQSFNEWKPFTTQEAIDRWNKRVPQTWTSKAFERIGEVNKTKEVAE